VKIDGNADSSVEACGRISLDAPTGYIQSATITVWTHTSTGGSCPVLYDVLAHEFGHLMGLYDVPDLSCAGHIMGRSLGGTSLRTVGADDCQEADQMWHTTYEDQNNDTWCEAYGCSPIMVDLDNNGFHLTGLDDPVVFDIDADKRTELLSWTRAGEMDALLALDRNGNGMIDDGGELFGNATRLANGDRAANGYEALAELDSWTMGGNGDGVIDSADAAFSSLQMWTDLNHDGVSQPDELQTLPEAGIVRMDVDYKLSRRTDRYGNQFRFLGRAWKQGRNGVVHPVVTWDVFFVVVH
jgi:hypothetical protein